MSNTSVANGGYSASDIEILTAVQAVRRRPAMYIGGVDGSGLQHLIWEQVANCIDEHLAGHTRAIMVKLDADGSVTVEDDGRGMPLEIAEQVMTTLHTGATFAGHRKHVHLRAWGVGVMVVNALSEWLELTIWRDGQEWRQRYERGVAVSRLEAVGRSKRTGTRIVMKPDAGIFPQIEFDAAEIAQTLRDVAATNAGLTTRFVDERSTTFERTHRWDDGVAGLIDAMTATRKSPQTRAIRCIGEEQDIAVDVAFRWVERGPLQLRAFANQERNTGGGTHVRGFRDGLHGAVHSITRRKLKPSTLEDGLVVMISVTHFDPKYGSPTKAVLVNPEVRPVVARIVKDAIREHFAADPKLLSRVLRRPARRVHRKAPISPERAELEAAVLAAPDDHAPRLVYSDWLLERGDMLGELIALQCAAERESDADKHFALECHADYLASQLA